ARHVRFVACLAPACVFSPPPALSRWHRRGRSACARRDGGVVLPSDARQPGATRWRRRDAWRNSRDRDRARCLGNSNDYRFVALPVKPPEYLALRMEPRAWAAEDSVLILASMFLTLQDAEARRESRLAAVYATLPPPLADFITSSSSEWETPLVGAVHPVPS